MRSRVGDVTDNVMVAPVPACGSSARSTAQNTQQPHMQRRITGKVRFSWQLLKTMCHVKRTPVQMLHLLHAAILYQTTNGCASASVSASAVYCIHSWLSLISRMRVMISRERNSAFLISSSTIMLRVNRDMHCIMQRINAGQTIVSDTNGIPHSYCSLRSPATCSGCSLPRPPRVGCKLSPLGSSTVSDVHFGHFSHALHPGIESATTFSCHTL